jgi:hypothetical protein
MNEVGKIIEQVIDLMNSGSYEAAMLPTAKAIEATAGKVVGKETVGDLSIERFVRDNWRFITFIGMPRALPLPMNVPFAFKRIMPTFNSYHGALEIVSMAVNQTLQTGRIPPEFAFNSNGIFEVKDKLLLPRGLVWGLLGGVIFSPANADETIGEDYWINIADFRMFVSELFGRQDLVERIIKFHRPVWV